MWGSGAHAISLSRSSALLFCNQLLSVSQFNFISLLNAGLLNRLDENVYVFKGSTNLYEHEIKSVAKFARIMNSPVVVIGNLPGLAGTPSVDAILFGDNIPQYVNISVKTNRGKSKNNTSFLKSATNAAESSVRDHYSAESIAANFGFNIINGELEPKPNVSYQDVKEQVIKGLLRVLGLEKNGEARPVTVLVDMSEGSYKWPRIDRSIAGDDLPEGDALMHVFDSANPENELENLAFVNLSKKMRNIRNSDTILSYYFLFHSSYVKVDRHGYQEIFYFSEKN